MNRLIINAKGKELAEKLNLEQLWDRYKAAKLMDDKDEVAIFRKAIKLRTEVSGTVAARAKAASI